MLYAVQTKDPSLSLSPQKRNGEEIRQGKKNWGKTSKGKRKRTKLVALLSEWIHANFTTFIVLSYSLSIANVQCLLYTKDDDDVDALCGTFCGVKHICQSISQLSQGTHTHTHPSQLKLKND